jgi:hypothetical protein
MINCGMNSTLLNLSLTVESLAPRVFSFYVFLSVKDSRRNVGSWSARGLYVDSILLLVEVVEDSENSRLFRTGDIDGSSSRSCNAG